MAKRISEKSAAPAVARERFIEAARNYIGVKFSHHWRTRENGIDCGGLILLVARELGIESDYPHSFDGTECRPGDLLTFDYKNGEGTRHIAVVTRWDGKRYYIIDSQPVYGVSEHPLAHPFSRAILKAWRVRGLSD